MLNQLVLSDYYKNKAAIAFIVFLLLISLSCGKRKAPLPPSERVPQRVEISGTQRGNAVTLLWTLPQNDGTDGSILKINRVDIYRLAETFNDALALSEEEFASRSTLIATLPISQSDFALRQISYTDILEFAGQPARLRYAIRFVNASGQKAAFSNFFLIEPTAKVADTPTSLSAQLSQDAIRLSWNAPVSNVDGSRPPNLIGYNVYKVSESSGSEQILNNTPIVEINFEDLFFEFGKRYRYFVRAVSLGRNSEPVESLNSNPLEISPQDTFPPSAPSAITIAAAPNNLSIFFAVNPEKDIAGYRIYRSTNASLNKVDWTSLTAELLKTNTFQDTNVETGITYYYYLTAVDNAGNVSQPSEVVSETAF